jgi:hypothetical protein
MLAFVSSQSSGLATPGRVAGKGLQQVAVAIAVVVRILLREAFVHLSIAIVVQAVADLRAAATGVGLQDGDGDRFLGGAGQGQVSFLPEGDIVLGDGDGVAVAADAHGQLTDALGLRRKVQVALDGGATLLDEVVCRAEVAGVVGEDGQGEAHLRAGVGIVAITAYGGRVGRLRALRTKRGGTHTVAIVVHEPLLGLRAGAGAGGRGVVVAGVHVHAADVRQAGASAGTAFVQQRRGRSRIVLEEARVRQPIRSAIEHRHRTIRTDHQEGRHGIVVHADGVVQRTEGLAVVHDHRPLRGVDEGRQVAGALVHRDGHDADLVRAVGAHVRVPVLQEIGTEHLLARWAPGREEVDDHGLALGQQGEEVHGPAGGGRGRPVRAVHFGTGGPWDLTVAIAVHSITAVQRTRVDGRVRIVTVAAHLDPSAGWSTEYQRGGLEAEAIAVRIHVPEEVLIHLAIAIVVLAVAQFRVAGRSTIAAVVAERATVEEDGDAVVFEGTVIAGAVAHPLGRCTVAVAVGDLAGGAVTGHEALAAAIGALAFT